MKNKTTEFSFILKPSEHGVGVFAAHNIEKDTYLRLFNEERVEVSILRRKEDVPETFKDYCVDKGDMMLCPKDFGCMEVGWYINHSKAPNAYHDNYSYYALRDIKEGEEITIDYNTLGEPEGSKAEYYKK